MNEKIPLELLAAKFAAVSNHAAPTARAALAAEPRARELLLYLQYQSASPGGLIGFAESFCNLCAESIGTPALRRLAGKAVLTPKERETVIAEIPPAGRFNVFTGAQMTATDSEKWLSENFWAHVETITVNYNTPFLPPVETTRRKEFVDTLDRTAFQRICHAFIKQFLPAELYRVCTEKDAWFSPAWYCADLPAALIAMMDKTAALAEKSLAKTGVAKAAFDALQFAIERKTFVRLDGQSRYGKSESVRTFAAMYPGKCRLIVTDCINADRDFFGAMADALGMERDFKTTASKLRMKIDYVAAHCGLCFIWDEAHFLMPSTLTKSKRPTRLDWVRTHLIDRGSPVVIVTTPQIYNAAAKRLTDVTGYNLEQWDGRIRRHVKLPEKISSADLLAIVQKKAPGFSEARQQIVSAAAMCVKGSYLAAVNAIIDTAFWMAQRAGHESPTLDDLEQAIEEAAPKASLEASSPDSVTVAPRPAAARPRATRPAAAELPAPARSVTPSLSTIEST